MFPAWYLKWWKAKFRSMNRSISLSAFARELFSLPIILETGILGARLEPSRPSKLLIEFLPTE
jgi:hypothetical protein